MRYVVIAVVPLYFAPFARLHTWKVVYRVHCCYSVPADVSQ